MTTSINFSTIKFAIPTYKRVDTIQSHTLALLEKFKVPRKQIYIFVANQEEYDLYNNALDSNPEKYNIILGVLGLCNQRNFITNYFKENAKIVNLDDDIKNLQVLENGTLHDLSISEFKYYIIKAFKLCKEHKANLWGISQTNNGYFLRDSITFNFSFIVGYFWGCINRHLPELNITLDIKEDYERTAKYWELDRTIVKFNMLCADTNVYNNAGGLQIQYPDRYDASYDACIELCEKYDALFCIRLGTLNSHHESRYPELRCTRGLITPNNYYIALPKINEDCEIIKSILATLNLKPLEINKKRLNCGEGMTQTFGKYKKRRQVQLIDSRNNLKYPELYDLLVQFANKYVVMHKPAYTSIQVNVNYESKPHIDKNNIGNSYIVGIGDYKGGDLILNSYRHNIKHSPILFNGKRYLHSTNSFTGSRISLIFFTLK